MAVTQIKETLGGFMAEYLIADLITGEAVDKTWSDGIAGVHKVVKGEDVFAMRHDLFEQTFTEEEQGAMADLGITSGRPAKVSHGGETQLCWVVSLTSLGAEIAKETRAAADESRVQRENRELKRQLKVAHAIIEESDVEAQVAGMVTDKVRALLEKKNSAMQKARTLKTSASSGKAGSVPTLMLSDLHWDEVVAPEEVEYMNEFNRDIAARRLDRVFDSAANLLFHHTAGVTHEEMVIIMGGDMVSGDIHGELARTNEAYTPETVMDLAERLAVNIRGMAKEFPSIYIPCVSGNHGRLTHKPTAKGRMTNSFDWLVYKVTEAMLADVPNVMFDVSRSADMTYKVYDWKYRLTHGDQFKGGSGVGGIFPSLMRTDMRKHKREASLRRDGYQYLVMGHFHRYSMQDGILVNGTLKGVDEYSYVSNFDVQPACQALWLTHPGYGMTVSMPVFCDEPAAIASLDAPPVTPSVQARKTVESQKFKETREFKKAA